MLNGTSDIGVTRLWQVAVAQQNGARIAGKSLTWRSDPALWRVWGGEILGACTPETIGSDHNLSVRSQTLTEEVQAVEEPLKPDRPR